jgi:drug/metabolite transporter (DMT)-like permease
MTDLETRDAALLRAAPLIFVLIWSTGFVVARFGMPHAPPMGFLAWRFALSLLAFAVWIRAAGAAWPAGRRQWAHLSVAGVLMQAGYLGGVWAAVKGGMSAGTAALIVGLQPLLTAVWLSATGSRHAATARQWVGLALGLAGLVLVVWRKLGLGEATGPSILLALVALAAITVGTLYQKRYVVPGNVRSANAVQLMAAFCVVLPLALLETEPIRWHPQMVGAMAWSVLVLTLGGSSLLVLLIQRGAATRVTSLLYLVPPCTAVLAWLLFDEALTPTVLAGMALTALGVWLVVRERAS